MSSVLTTSSLGGRTLSLPASDLVPLIGSSAFPPSSAFNPKSLDFRRGYFSSKSFLISNSTVGLTWYCDFTFALVLSIESSVSGKASFLRASIRASSSSLALTLPASASMFRCFRVRMLPSSSKVKPWLSGPSICKRFFASSSASSSAFARKAKALPRLLISSDTTPSSSAKGIPVSATILCIFSSGTAPSASKASPIAALACGTR